MVHLAVTGATGFVGSAVAVAAAQHGHRVRAISRADLGKPDFSNIDAVIHCAAIAHRRDIELAETDAVNHRLPLALAAEARRQGVGRFVFLSSINVVAGHAGPIGEDAPIAPISAYGEAKAKAEAGLKGMSGIDIAIVRPPLVYGPGAPGNLRRLVALCRSPLPLPFGRANNRRSMIGLSNLVSAILYLAEVPGAAKGRVFHVTDAALSTAYVVRTIREAMGRKPGLVPVPPALGEAVLRALGRGAMFEQLFGDLVVRGEGLAELGWKPSVAPENEIARMARFGRHRS